MDERLGRRGCENWAPGAGVNKFDFTLIASYSHIESNVPGLLSAAGGAGESEPAADGCAQQEVHPPRGDGRAVEESELQDQRDACPVRAAQPQTETGLHESQGRDRGGQQGQGRERGGHHDYEGVLFGSYDFNLRCGN